MYGEGMCGEGGGRCVGRGKVPHIVILLSRSTMLASGTSITSSKYLLSMPAHTHTHTLPHNATFPNMNVKTYLLSARTNDEGHRCLHEAAEGQGTHGDVGISV